MDYRIDDLAHAAGMTTRNVRAYLERGLLPPPRKTVGRAKIYDDSHLERLKIIGSLLSRGFTTAHIADFIHSWSSGKDLTEVLGLQHAVTAEFGTGGSVSVPRAMVEAFLGEDSDILPRLANLNVARVSRETVTFASAEVLESFSELRNYGYRLREVLSVYESVVPHLEEIAHLMVDAARRHIVAEHGDGWLPDSDSDIAATTDMLTHLRKVGVSVAHSGLAAALDRAVNAELGTYLEAAVTKSAKDSDPRT